MSSSGTPRRSASAMPSPVSVWALEVVLKILPAPPVAKTTDLARNTWISPVRQLVGDHACDPHVGALARPARGPQVGVHQHVQDVELVVELDVVLHALLVQGLQDHVTGAVGRVAGAAHGGLAVVAGVPAEPPLVDLALGRAVERQPHLLQVEDGVDRLLGHDLRRVLVDQVVAALDRVEGVPLPVVLLDVRQRGAHAALGRAGVRPGRVELGEHRRAGAAGGLERRSHAGAAGTDDDDVVGVGLHHVSFVGSGRQPAVQKLGSRSAGAPGGHGLNEKITRVPSTTTTVNERNSAVLSTSRVPVLVE